MSQVHEKLQNLPASEGETARPTLSIAGGVGNKRKLSGRPPRKVVIAGLFGSALLIAGVVGFMKWMAMKQAQIDAQPVQRDPVIEAASLFKQERYAEAIPLLEEILKADPQSVAAKINLAYARKKTGDVAQAKRSLEEIVAEHPEEPTALNNLGRLYGAEGQWEKAAELFSRALAAQPEYPAALANAAAAFEALHQWEKSVAHYEKFLTIDQEHSGVHQSIRQRVRRLRSFQTYAAQTSQKAKSSP